MIIVRVALPVHVDRAFDYRLRQGPAPAVGARVRVPLGRRRVVGVVLGLPASSEVPRDKLRPIDEVLDHEPLVPPELMELCRRMAAYYHHPLGEVLATAIPVWLRQGRAAKLAPSWSWRLTAAGRAVDPGDLGRAIRQRQVLERLADGALAQSELTSEQGIDTGVLAALADKGWIERCRGTRAGAGATEAGPTLTEHQQLAVDAISARLDAFGVWLLDGVTGSGKTEVYLDLVGRVLEGGRQALIMVPEIGLTPQFTRRFRRRLGDRVGVLHSGVADGERTALWLKARDGRLDVVLGTRSAVFAPLARPGLIVVDEEHDASLKQQDGLRYSARDMAVLRGQALGVPVLLGSATPSLETLHNVEAGRFRRLELPRRAGPARPPGLERVDLRSLPGDEGLSPRVREAVREHIDRGEQVLLFLNRRGFSPVLMCHACGWYAECPRCDARMTLHRSENSLRCHHCDRQQAAPTVCPSCSSDRLEPLGHGTQRLEAEVEGAFPGVPVLRLDRDSLRRRDAWDEALERIRGGEACILVGTQLLAKGHDYAGITLVVVINLDQALFSSDFRAGERAAQLLVQVAGRAGRGNRPGTVMVQTHHPDHPLFRRVLHEGYGVYARELLDERRAAGLPPATHLAMLRAEAHRSRAVQDFMERARDAAGRPRGVQVLGPLPAPMERRAGRYRMQLMLIAARRADLHGLLTPWVAGLYELEGASRVRWSIDVDPADSF